MRRPVIVFGPAGCGKTRNAEYLRRDFDLLHIADGTLDEERRVPLRSDTLYLTYRGESDLRRTFPGTTIIAFSGLVRQGLKQ